MSQTTSAKTPVIPSGNSEIIPILNNSNFEDQWEEFSETLFSRIPLNSQRALAFDLKDYFATMARHQLVPLRESVTELAHNVRIYVTDMAGHRKMANATIRRRISSVRKFFRLKLNLDPVASSELLRTYISRELALNSLPPSQATPARAQHLAVMNATFAERRLSDLRAKLMMNLAYDTLARSDELRQLRLEHINSEPQTNAHSILITNAKNDQEGIGSARFISQTTYQILMRYLEQARVQNGYIFRKLSKHNSLAMNAGTEPLSYQTMVRDLSKICDFVDFGGRKVTGHSYRVGAVQDMVVNGYTNSQIALAGGWSNEAMPAYYARMLRANESAAADMARKLGR